MTREPLYQVFVETRERAQIPVGPAMIRQAAEMFMDAIVKAIVAGTEQTWSNPTLYRVAF